MAHPHHAQAHSVEAHVRHALEHTSHLLPDQAPIRVFIHHNTLHAFQHLHFHEAVLQGKAVYGAEPYISQARFREYLKVGRITEDDLEAALHDQLGDDGKLALISDLLDLHGLRTLLLKHEIVNETPASLSWKIHERSLLKRLRDDVGEEARGRLVGDTERWLRLLLEPGTQDAAQAVGSLVTGELDAGKIEAALADDHDVALSVPSLRKYLDEDPEPLCVSALWFACRDAVRGYARPEPKDPRQRMHRDIVLSRSGRDVYDLVFPVLIRLCAAYLDDGIASEAMPARELGFYRSVRRLVGHGSVPVSRWLRQVRKTFADQEAKQAEPMQVVVEALSELGVQADDVEPYVERLLLSLPGWAGMMARLERNPEDRPAGAPPASLLEFLAVRLVYEVAALRYVAENQLEGVPLRSLNREQPTVQGVPRFEHDATLNLFQVLQLSGVSVPRLRALERQQAHDIVSAIDGFDDVWRRRVFQEAFERHHRCQILDALAAHRQSIDLTGPVERPVFQLITCFDEREESFRRQLEEVEPDCQTFGAPGFFGAAMRFRAIDEPGAVPLAPVVIKPTHQIEERPRLSDASLHLAREQRRRLMARLSHELHRGSRSLWRGAILNAALGLVAALPLLTRILSPRSAGKIRKWTSERLLPSPRTELTIHHEANGDEPVCGNPLHQRGFKVDERVTRVATVLENLGFTEVFSKLVIVVGHGATTMNNPHKSAYDCGACGGRQGGPNARVFCHMANEAAVRQGLAERGIHIPDDTWFVGGQHDTCSDDVTLLDLEAVPESHRELLRQSMQKVHTARARTAQERCRRLFSAPADPSADVALRHVEGRAEHLAEPRPEFGHATNAIAVIGRRAVTRGLFLDRRAFLLSYDPTTDTNGSILERTLAAATPVGAGINLEYYFSHVDNDHYGAGSKLPHNVTGLIGVMSGHASDLRTGLPRQMIEIHEPVRLLVIVEATPERLLEIAGRQAEVRELVTKRWIQLVSLHPDTGEMQVFTDRGFVTYTPAPVNLPKASTSRDFYRGHHGFLPPAQIRSEKSRAA